MIVWAEQFNPKVFMFNELVEKANICNDSTCYLYVYILSVFIFIKRFYGAQWWLERKWWRHWWRQIFVPWNVWKPRKYWLVIYYVYNMSLKTDARMVKCAYTKIPLDISKRLRELHQKEGLTGQDLFMKYPQFPLRSIQRDMTKSLCDITFDLCIIIKYFMQLNYTTKHKVVNPYA